MNTVVLNVNCGDSINVNNYRTCSGSYVGTGWIDSTNSMMLLQPKIKMTSSAVYYQEFYTNTVKPRLTCVNRIVVNVIQKAQSDSNCVWLR